MKKWFDKILPSFIRQNPEERPSPIPQGLWQSCPNCNEIIYGPDLEENFNKEIDVLTRIVVDSKHKKNLGVGILPNLLGETAIYHLTRKKLRK